MGHSKGLKVMSNIINFSKAKKAGKSEAQPDSLERVKQILSPKKAKKTDDQIKRVKEILKSQDFKYRISHKELNQKDYPKGRTICFPKHKLIFVFIKDGMNRPKVPLTWTLESLVLDSSLEAINYVAQIISHIKELSQNAKTGTEVEPCNKRCTRSS